jgi:hypothetical protein
MRSRAVKYSPAFSRLAQRRIAGVLFATSRAIAGTSVPDADAMMIIARRTRTDPCFPRRTICSSRRPS